MMPVIYFPYSILLKVFFIIPCIDIYEKIDLRTQTYDVPPQEVRIKIEPPAEKIVIASTIRQIIVTHQ